MKKCVYILLITILLATASIASGKEPVKLFLEDDGSKGKINPVTAVDQNLHPNESFFYNENYFLIAISEDDYYGYVNLLISNTGIKPKTPGLSFTIVTPDRKRLVKDIDFAPDDLVMAKNKFDLKLKDNYFMETEKGYKLRFFEDGLGMELEYINNVPGLVLGNGKSVFGESGEDYFYINYPGPRPDVTGKFFIEGKEIPIKGWGYLDHSITVTDPTGFQDVWHNFKFHSDTHTVLISSFTTPENYEKDFGFGLVTDNEKALCVFTDVLVKEENVKTDEESGKPYAGKVSYELIGDDCSVKASINTSNPAEKFDVLKKLEKKWWGKAAKAVINTFISEPWYFRAVEPVDVEITINGEKTVVKGQAFNEVIFTN
jgi:Svf1-like C-terminal lipocalin-like domain